MFVCLTIIPVIKLRDNNTRVVYLLVDSEDGANNYADFCIHPDAQYKNKSAQWTSSITPDHPMFKVMLVRFID